MSTVTDGPADGPSAPAPPPSFVDGGTAHLDRSQLVILRKVEEEIRPIREDLLVLTSKVDSLLAREARDHLLAEGLRGLGRILEGLAGHLAKAISQPGSLKYVAIVVCLLTAAIWGVSLTYGDLVVGGGGQAEAQEPAEPAVDPLD